METPETPKKRGRPKLSTFPEFIVCPVTKKSHKVNVTILTKYLNKHNITIDQYLASYVSREGKVILADNNDNTPETPIIDEKIREVVEEEMFDNIEKNGRLDRKELLKVIWERITQHPPEYYQEKFKLQRAKHDESI